MANLTHKIGLGAVESAIYARLTTDALTSAYTVGIYMSPNTALPYVSIGGGIWGKSRDFTTRDDKAEDVVVHAHIWSAQHGDDEVTAMMNNISQAVTASVLSISGYTEMIGISDYANVIIDASNPNQLLRHGVLRFRFQIA